MDERIAFAEKETETTVETEKEIQNEAELEEESEFNGEQAREEKKARRINIFSSSAFAGENEVKFERKKQEKEPEPQEEIEEKVVETPNYDLIEGLTEEQRVKVFKIEKAQPEEKVKPKNNRFKYIIMSVLFAIFGVWGIVNIAQIDQVTKSVAEVTSEYNMNLVSYLNKLKSLDATSTENMQKLVDTIPEKGEGASQIKSHSNWFDRLCDFLSGLFN